MDYLFHYTNEKNIEFILKNQTLLFNNIDKTNDPYENKMFDTYDKNEEREFNKNDDNNLYIDQLTKKYISGEKDRLYKVYSNDDDFSFDLDNNSYYENCLYSEKLEDKIYKNIEKNLDEMDNDHQAFYFKSFTNMKNRITKTISFSTGEFNKSIGDNNRPGYFYPRMWAQYGNKSKGVCFVFKKNELLKTIKEKLSSDFDIFAKPIIYTDILDINHVDNMTNLIKQRNKIFRHPSQKKEAMLINNMIKNVDDYFFTKDKDWEGEHEFRILIINKPGNKDINHKIIKLNMSKVLHSVVLGENFIYRNENEEQINAEKELNSVKYLCKKMNIRLYFIIRNNYRSKYILNSI